MALLLCMGVSLAGVASDAAFALRPLKNQEVEAFVERITGCRADLVANATGERFGAVANGAWIMLASPDPLEMAIVFRDKYKGAREVHFGRSILPPGTRIEGVMRLDDTRDKACADSASGCRQFQARLQLQQVSISTPTKTLLDEAVTLIDFCGTDRKKRVFTESSWIERQLFQFGRQ